MLVLLVKAVTMTEAIQSSRPVTNIPRQLER